MRVRRTMLAISTAFVVSSSDMSSSCACGIGSSCEHSEQITQSLHAQDACMARLGGVSALESPFSALASANLMTVRYVFPTKRKRLVKYENIGYPLAGYRVFRIVGAR